MTVGILGGGQLGRMLALAGYPLGFRFIVVDPVPDACAGQLTTFLNQEYSDDRNVSEIARSLDVITYEFENVDFESPWFHCGKPVYPPVEALRASQDRLSEKTLFQDLGIETPAFHAIESHDDLRDGFAQTGLPAVLKTRRFGYDGKGQYAIRSENDVPQLEAPMILESFVEFDRELSIIAVRSTTGETAFYPLVENVHREGILRRSIAPAPNLSGHLQKLGEEYAGRVLERLNYVGVLAIEFFQVGDRLLANEMAPRVHNSGHWTIEGAETSQFENHLRAITGMPLGSSTPLGYAGMINLIGRYPPRREALSISGAHLHLYDKLPRPGRKVGHITAVAPTLDELSLRLAEIEKLVS